MAKRTREELRRALGLPEDQPGVVNVLVYRGTVYGVYERYDDAYEAGIKQFGEGAMSFLDAHISRQFSNQNLTINQVGDILYS